MPQNPSLTPNESPYQVKDGLFIFPPDADQEGKINTCWWLDFKTEPVLIDCPTFNAKNIEQLKKLAAGRRARIVLTSRFAHQKVASFQSELDWPVILQEQEAYLLPQVKNKKVFGEEYSLDPYLKLLWTPGPTPGSCVLHSQHHLNVLFCGRLLIPVAKNKLAPVRSKMTFHWSFQKKSLLKLRKWIPSNALPSLACAVNPLSCGQTQIFNWDSWDKSQESHNFAKI